ncbi:hypothetical protein BCR33DRAFT_518403 [Rhizoclosmatium globosum]|uniref:Uncharacterized protein n=1 Tax=Rhizoclosmatium globosum TaxID=329046 RepID=A0A1Y2BFE6_9FUNG|nr:hypothetical protein BCR33DRAFT_518403 [Rhizoclosmatium globosum]|eukprot:ORY33538.1 hypothetical protein BCR33DRAFT_518403 [Rhizoclosmatium globosum]
MALVQHIDGSFIAWSPASVRAAISNIDANKIQSLNMSTGSVEAFDIPTAGAYPITMVSNFIINPQHISSEPHVTIGTLKFLWMFLQNPKYAQLYNFSSLYNTTLAAKKLSYLQTISLDGTTPIYGQSVCDVQIDGTYKIPCVHGTCKDLLPFQNAAVQCQCDTDTKTSIKAIAAKNPDIHAWSATAARFVLFGFGIWF